MRRRNPPPTNAPEYFLDRCLSKRVGEQLAAEGWTIHPMFEVYPRSERRRIEDVTWIPEVTEWGWIVLSKDSFRLRHEKQMIRKCEARVFSLPNGNMTTEAMVARFVVNEERIVTAASDGGPCHYAVGHDRLRRIELA